MDEGKVKQILQEGRERYKDSEYRTHHNASAGKVYDLKKLEGDQYLKFVSSLTPDRGLSEAIQPGEKSRPFLDLDQPKTISDGNWILDWDSITAKLTNLGAECIALLKFYHGSIELSRTHLIFQNGTSESVHREFKDLEGYDPQDKSLRLPYQYTPIQFKTRPDYYVPLLYFRQGDWHEIVIGPEQEIEYRKREKPWIWVRKFPGDDREPEYLNVYNIAYKRIKIPEQLWKMMTIRGGNQVVKEKKKKKTKKSIEMDVEDLGDMTAELQLLREIVDRRSIPFVIGPQCDMGPFDSLKVAEEVYLAIRKEGSHLSFADRDRITTGVMNNHMRIISSSQVAVRGYCLLDGTTTLSIRSATDLKKEFAPHSFQVKIVRKPDQSAEDVNKEKERHNLWNIWWTNKLHVFARGVKFMPQYKPFEKVPDEIDGYINTYTGLAYPMKFFMENLYIQEDYDWAAKMQSFLYEKLCDSNPHLFAYFLYFIYFCIITPEKNCQTFLYIYGPQGTGKSVFIKHVMKIFGIHGIQVHSFDEFCNAQSFNGHLGDKIIVNIDEIDLTAKSNMNQLKRAVTSERKELRQKFKETEQIPNYLKIIGTSNKTPQEIIDVLQTHEPLQRRIVIFGIADHFNRLTNKNVIEETNFLIDPETDDKYFTGLLCWYTQFFMKEDLSGNNFNFFNDSNLKEWQGGRHIPYDANIVNFDFKMPSENILIRYLNTLDSINKIAPGLKNPLLAPYWGVYNNNTKYPDINDPVQQLRKKMTKNYSFLNNKIKLNKNRDVWERIICLDFLIEDILEMVDNRVLDLKNKADLTVANIERYFKDLVKSTSVRVPIPKTIINVMKRGIENHGILTMIKPPTDVEFKPHQTGMATHTTTLTFLDIGTEEEFSQKLIQARKIPTETLKKQDKNDDQNNFQRIYGGADSIETAKNFFVYNPRKETEASPPGTPMGKSRVHVIRGDESFEEFITNSEEESGNEPESGDFE